MKFLKSEVALFIYKAAGIYLCWYLVYELWLLPDGRLDEWVTTNIAGITGGILGLMNFDAYVDGRLFGIGDAPGILLVDGCSGISAIGLFLGFILAYPGEWSRRIYFSIFGILVIYLVNIFRSVVLAVTQVYWPHFFDITHDYSTTIIFYVVIFFLWVLWANLGEQGFTKSGTPEVSTA